jgi:hypothetical protein
VHIYEEAAKAEEEQNDSVTSADIDQLLIAESNTTAVSSAVIDQLLLSVESTVASETLTALTETPTELEKSPPNLIVADQVVTDESKETTTTAVDSPTVETSNLNSLTDQPANTSAAVSQENMLDQVAESIEQSYRPSEPENAFVEEKSESAKSGNQYVEQLMSNSNVASDADLSQPKASNLVDHNLIDMPSVNDANKDCDKIPPTAEVKVLSTNPQPVFNPSYIPAPSFQEMNNVVNSGSSQTQQQQQQQHLKQQQTQQHLQQQQQPPSYLLPPPPPVSIHQSDENFCLTENDQTQHKKRHKVKIFKIVNLNITALSINISF